MRNPDCNPEWKIRRLDYSLRQTVKLSILEFIINQ